MRLSSAYDGTLTVTQDVTVAPNAGGQGGCVLSMPRCSGWNEDRMTDEANVVR